VVDEDARLYNTIQEELETKAELRRIGYWFTGSMTRLIIFERTGRHSGLFK